MTQVTDKTDLLTPAEAAKKVGRCAQDVCRNIRNGRIRAEKRGPLYFVRLSDVVAHYASVKHGGARPGTGPKPLNANRERQGSERKADPTPTKANLGLARTLKAASSGEVAA